MTEPRLLTEAEAAEYLALPCATVRRLGIGRVRLGIRTRYDRLALDAHLDGLRGVSPTLSANDDDSPEAALARFTQRGSNAPRHA